MVIGIYFFSQHQQSPSKEDVYSSTQDWTPPVIEVFNVTEIDGQWFTFFRKEETLLVAELKKDWLGRWVLNHPSEGVNLPISGTPFNLEDNNGVVFDSVGISQSYETIATFYYGMINNENIKSITIESAGENFDNIPLIKSNDNRFFLLKKRGEQVPYTFKGYDSNGEVEVIIEGR